MTTLRNEIILLAFTLVGTVLVLWILGVLDSMS